MFSWSSLLADRVAYTLQGPVISGLLALFARALMAYIFIMAGYNKYGSFEATQGYMATMGVNPAYLPAVIALEFGGGLALLFGWQARLVAAALAIFCVISGVLFHGDGESINQIMLMKNLAIAGGLLAIVRTGAGFPALDKH